MGQYGPFSEDLSDTSKQAVAVASANPTSNFGPFASDLEGGGGGIIDKLEQVASSRMAQARQELSRRPGESLLHTAARDYLDMQEQVGEHAIDIGKGLARPFKTVFEGGLGDFLKPGDAIRAPTPGQTALAGAQAAATGLAPGAEAALSEKLGGGLLARVAARGTVGGGVGALFNPEHPVVGAAAGALGGVAVGGVVGKGASPAAAATAEATDATAAPEAGVSLETMIQNFRNNAEKLAASKEGFTFDPRTGEMVQNGNMVGLGNQPGVFAHADENPLTEFNSDATEQIIRNNADLFNKDPRVMLGGEGTELGLNVEPSRNYANVDEAFNAGVEGGQRAIGNLTNGEYTPIPTSGPDALAVYRLAKQYGVNPSDVSGLTYDLETQEENPVAETLARIGAAAKEGANVSAVGGVASATGMGKSPPPGLLPSVSGAQEAHEGVGGGDVPPAGGAEAAGGPQEPPRLESGDAQTGPGSPDGQRLYDDRIPDDQFNINDWINASKYSMADPDAEGILHTLVRRYVQNNGLVKERIPWAQTVKEATENGIDPDVLAKITAPLDRIRTVQSMFFMRRTAMALSGLGQRFRELKSQGLDGQAEEIFGRMTDLIQQFDGVAGRFIQGKSEVARTLNIMKQTASQITDPTVWLIRAKQKLGEEPLTPAIQAKVESLAGWAGDAPRGSLQRNVNLARLAKFTDSLGPTDRWYNAGAAYRAGLLSSPSSLIGATAGHITWAIYHGGEQNLIAGVDQLMSKITGLHNLGFNPLADLRARYGGVKTAMPKVKALLRYGVTGDEVGRSTDMTREFRLTTPQERFEMDDILHRSGDVAMTVAGKRVAETYVNMLRRLYGVVPTIIREQAEAAARAARARGVAMSENLGGALLDQRVQDLMANPTPEMTLYAKAQGEAAALTARTVLGDVLNRVTGVVEKFPGGRLATAVFAPFKTVPSNIATIPLQRMPWMVGFGMRNFAMAATRKGLTQEARAALQLKAAEQIVHGGGGAALLGAGMWLTKHELITPPSSDKPSVNQTNMLLGRQPNAFHVGGSFISGAKLQPITTMLGLGALIYHAMTDPGPADTEGRIGGVVEGYAKMLSDAPFFEGMANVTHAIENPGARASKLTEDVVKGAIPSILRHTAQAIDPYQHTVTNQGIDKYFQTAESAFPGLSKNLPVAVDQLGHPITRQGGIGAFAPFPAMADKAATDPVAAAIAASGSHISQLKQYPGETVEQFQQRSEMAGKLLDAALQRVVASKQYQTGVGPAAARLIASGRYGGTQEEVEQALRRKIIETVASKVHAIVNRRFAAQEGRIGPRQLRAFLTPNTNQDEEQQ